jgi:hypothetical protein
METVTTITSRIAKIFVIVFIFFPEYAQIRYVYLNITIIALKNNDESKEKNLLNQFSV